VSILFRIELFVIYALQKRFISFIVLISLVNMGIMTKSANILRDLDLFKKINSKTKYVIQITL